METFEDRIQSITERVKSAAERAGRSVDEIEIMAVTKTRSYADVNAMYNSGIHLFGENRVQEAEEKFKNSILKADLHLIGHLQSNKAKTAAEIFSCVESIDKVKTADALNKWCIEKGKIMNILLELNTSGEESKNGFPDNNTLFYAMDEILPFPNLKIRGLMTIGPFTMDKKRIRASFRTLFNTGIELNKRFPDISANVLSMGMSSDFEIAVEEGATRIRLGTILFGKRDY